MYMIHLITVERGSLGSLVEQCLEVQIAYAYYHPFCLCIFSVYLQVEKIKSDATWSQHLGADST